MHRFFAIALLILIGLNPIPAKAATDCLAKYIPTATSVGMGAGTRFIFHAYDAELFAPQGTYVKDRPFALELTYRMQFSGSAIARESIKQMQRMRTIDQKTIADWHQKMATIFPDVTPGMSITGLRLENGKVVFCTLEREIGQMTDKDFADAFFGIWLDEKAESPALRRQLTGQP